MANRISAEDIVKINEVYRQLKTYAATARATGFSPGTVKKYVQTDFAPVEISEDKRFKKEDIPEMDLSLFHGKDNLGVLCVLSSQEEEEIRLLWKEIQV